MESWSWLVPRRYMVSIEKLNAVRGRCILEPKHLGYFSFANSRDSWLTWNAIGNGAAEKNPVWNSNVNCIIRGRNVAFCGKSWN